MQQQQHSLHKWLYDTTIILTILHNQKRIITFYTLVINYIYRLLHALLSMHVAHLEQINKHMFYSKQQLQGVIVSTVGILDKLILSAYNLRGGVIPGEN